VLHLTTSGWLNDPLGVTHRDGLYHLFFQAVPGSDRWRPECRWGHAVSADLVHWEHRPTALAPDAAEVGCWSGGVCVVPGAEGRDTARLFYTSVTLPDLDLGSVRDARPLDDRWDAWQQGPVVVRPPAEADLRVFRDPVVLPQPKGEGGGWRMLVGAGHRDGTPAVLTFTSTDLERWTFDGALATGRQDAGAPAPPGGLGAAWECPQLVRVGDAHVLVVSTWEGGVTGEVLAGVGDHRDGRMRVRRWQRLTAGGGPYAPTAFADAAGQPCLLFWLRGVGDPAGGWTGALSLPYRLGLRGDELRLAPHPQVLRALGAGLPGVRHVVVPGADGPVHVVRDGPLVEVCTGTAVTGIPLTPEVATTPPASTVP
jgi:beta-fructofuranosidase